MIMVSGPMVSDRAKTSYGLIAACRCISIWPDASYARWSSSGSSTRLTPRQAPPSNGFMNIGKPTRPATSSRSKGRL